MANIITRRSFLKTSFITTAGAGIAAVMNVPPFLKRALAEGTIGLNGKKLLFIFLRGGNDGVNNVIPALDQSYFLNRATIGIKKHPAGDSIYQASGGPGTCPGLDPLNPDAAIPLCNGFAGLHPAMSDMVPLYNAGDLGFIHRVAYRTQSRSHFDSERYWEKAADGTSANRLISDGIWYRTIVESGWNLTHALAGVSIQSNMPQSLRGEQPMTNLSSVNRYNLLGVGGGTSTTNNVTVNADRIKLLNAIDAGMLRAHPTKDNRDLVHNLGIAFRDTLDIFQDPAFQTNEFYDQDGTTHLFPINAGSDQRGLGSGAYGFMQSIKTCAQILASTDAIITGTELGGFDTHTNQVTPGATHQGGHATLLRRLAWAFYALSRFFNTPAYNSQGRNIWDDVTIVTMSEFGRTSAENASTGTDHAEASVMYLAGGKVNGGVYGCSLQTYNGVKDWDPGDGGKNGSLFAANNSVGYLKRTIDYRSVLGEIIREHLGATQGQLNRIIPGYANESVEHLKTGGTISGTPIVGELNAIA